MTAPIAKNEAPAIIFVLGMHRSGTSALAKVLGYTGGHIPADVLPPNQDNPRGYWEPQSVVALNNKLFQQVDRHWSDPKPLSSEQRENLLNSTNVDAAAAVLRSEIDATGSSKRPLILKDPRLCRVMPVWREAAAACSLEPRCIITYRNPFEVAQSLFARDRMKLVTALELWLTYMLETERGTRGMGRTVVSFEDLMTDWRGTLARAADAADICGLDLDSAASQVVKFLDRRLVKSHAAKTTESIEGQPELALAVDNLAKSLRGHLDSLAQKSDEVASWWEAQWHERSPGQAGSGVACLLPSWHVEKGMSHLASGRHTEAREMVECAISMAPDIARFHFILANIDTRIGDLEQALVGYRRAVSLDPTVSRFQLALSETLLRQGDYAGAAEVLHQTIALEPTAAMLRRYGQVLTQAGRLNEAVEALTRALQLAPKSQGIHLALADILERLSRWETALEHLTEVSRIGGETADNLDRQARVYALMGRIHEASKLFLQAAEHRRRSLRAFRNDGNDKDQQEVRRRLIKLIARFAARYWADNLASLLESGCEGTTTMRSQSTQQKVRRRLSKLIGRFAARYWAENLASPLGSDCKGLATTWPEGTQLARRSRVELAQPNDTNRNDAPLLSVMIPVYDIKEPKWLEECLESVLNQEGWGEKVEVVVMDDGSASDVARSVATEFHDRVRYVYNSENLGLVGHHNRCIAHARGEFVHILHQDDLVKPGFYDAVVKPMQDDSSIVAAFCATRYINEQGVSSSKSSMEGPQRGVLDPWPVRLSEIRIQFPSIVVRRGTYARVGGFCSRRPFAFDWDLWNHIAASGPIWYEPRPLACYRTHTGSATYSFGALARIHDAMRTVADMVRLIPASNRRLIGEMAMYKVLHRYLTLASERSMLTDDEQSDVQRFLLSGWVDSTKDADILAMLAAIQQEIPSGVSR